tara:strand:- start:377 stop:835 length:459 start_codon:yes stop_codon:yes gene_type:complete
MAYYRDSVQEDVFELAKKMRQADVREVKASNGASPLEALQRGFEASKPQSIIHKGELIGMFGCAHIDELRGSPWMLGSDKIPQIRKDLLTQSVEWVKEVNKQYPLLINYVDANNKVSINWLKHIGFSFVQLIPKFGVGGIPFYEFVRINQNV